MIKTFRKTSRLTAETALRDAVWSIGILAACSVIGFLFHSWRLSEANIISIYIIGILLVSSIASSWIYGTIASVCGVLLFNFLYADPIFNFYVYDLQYSITTVLMLIVSLITNYIMTLFRSQLAREQQEIQRLDILLETSQHLQQAETEEDIFNVALMHLNRMFDHPVVIFPVVKGVLREPLGKISANDQEISFLDASLDRTALKDFIQPENEERSIIVPISTEKVAICFNLMSRESIFAVICIAVDHNDRLPGFEYNLVLAMLDEIALSLEKYHLHRFNERIAREAEAERLRTNLLRTISHDLRTPLTSISGTADILLSSEEQIEHSMRLQLYQNIQDDSEWLISLVENLLFVTRIDNGTMSINTEYEALQDIIQESLHAMAKRTKEHTVHCVMSDAPLVVKVDARLIMQVMVNILDNAAKYAPSGSTISVNVFRDASQAVVTVADAGCGIAEVDKPKVFEMFYTTNKNSSDSRRGIGLGLPLCRSIVNAHGGDINLADNSPSGLQVRFSLPLEETYDESQYSGH